MNTRLLIIVCFLFLFCQKSLMNQEGFREVEKFDWSVSEQENRLTVKLYLTDSPMSTITSAVVKIKVEGMTLENKFTDLMVKIDTEGVGLRKGSKYLEHNWIPSITITKSNIELIQVFVK